MPGLNFGGGSNSWLSNPDALNESFNAAGGLESVASQGGSMPFPILGAIGLGTSLLGNIFGGLSQAKKERDALRREQSRKPFQLSKDASAAFRTGYSPNLGQNIFSLMPLLNPRMAAIIGSRYSSIYNPGQFAAKSPQPHTMPGSKVPVDDIYREVALSRYGG